jgi:hypothetical protein
MPDNLDRQKPEDPTKINIHQQWELNFWTNELGVTETELKNAVREVGPMVKDVKKHLNE